MATPSPSPELAVELIPQQTAPVAAPAMPTGPVCGACRDAAVVNWRRRLTDGELAEHVALEQARREEALLLADPQLPAPVFPPLPTSDDMTRTLYACAAHAIGMDAASRIHEASCTAPNETGQHGCDCTPEPHPDPEPVVDEMTARLPDHWTTGGA